MQQVDPFVTASIVFFVSIGLCILPKVLTETTYIKKVFPYITIFAAGFMLAVMLVDFIPHVNMRSDDVCCKKHKSEEDCTDVCRMKKIQETRKHGHKHEHGSTTGFFVAGLAFISLLAIDSIVLKHSHCDNPVAEQKASGDCALAEHVQLVADGAQDHSHDEVRGDNGTRSRQHTEIEHDHNYNEVKHENGGSIGCCNTDAIKHSTTKLQAFIYVLALSIHSLFEGLAFRSSKSNMSAYEWGIIFHKALESFALGATIFNTNFSTATAFTLALFYSALTPFGILVRYSLRVSPYVTTVFNGLALGSMLFIVCVEMIPPAFHSSKNNTLKMTVLLTGYLVTSLVINKTHVH